MNETRPVQGLRLPPCILQTLQKHAQTEAPRECVGLLFGVGLEVTRSVALRNIAESPTTRFFADPLGVLHALKDADNRGDSLLAVYHSHPKGPAALSQLDLDNAQPGLVQLLLSPGTVRAFVVRGGAAQEVGLEAV